MFDQFTIYDVMSIVGLDPTRIHSSSGYFDCPICGGKKKLNVNPNVGYGGVCRCAKCSAGGDKLDLFLLFCNPHLVAVRSSSQSGSLYYKPSDDDRQEGMRELERLLHLSRQQPGYLEKIHQQQKRIEEAASKGPKVSSPEHRNAVYTAFLGLLKLTGPHREALRARGLTDADIERAMFRSTPLFGRKQIAQKLVAQGLSLENVPGFFKISKCDQETGEVTEEWSVYCPDPGYFVPIRNRDGYIVSMQIRLNKPTTDKNKYLFFSSGRETLEGGVSAVSEIHVEMCSESPRYVYITEGPIKGYVSRSLYQRLYGKDDMIVLCIVGTSNFGGINKLLQWLLQQYDIEIVVEAYDLDKFTNQYVARDRSNLEKEIKQTMLEMRKELSDQYENGKIRPKYVSFAKDRYLGKGIDDHLLALWNKSNTVKEENHNMNEA